MVIVVSLVSLVLATAMTIVAWKLARDSRKRSSARVEELEALALGETDDERFARACVRRVRPPRSFARLAAPVPATPAPVPVRFTALEDDAMTPQIEPTIRTVGSARRPTRYARLLPDQPAGRPLARALRRRCYDCLRRRRPPCGAIASRVAAAATRPGSTQPSTHPGRWNCSRCATRRTSPDTSRCRASCASRSALQQPPGRRRRRLSLRSRGQVRSRGRIPIDIWTLQPGERVAVLVA